MGRRFSLVFCVCFSCLILFGCKTISRSRPEFKLPPNMVIISFDDGPNIHNDTTTRLLDVLKKHEITAMFSLLGERCEVYPDLVRRIYDEGHYIINHGYSDKLISKMDSREFEENLLMGEAAINSALGKEYNLKLYRPHGGFYNLWQENYCIEKGYTIIPADIRVYDAIESERNKNKIVKKVLRKVIRRSGGIILLHDARDSYYRTEEMLSRNPNSSFNRSWIPDVTEEIINSLTEKGFTIGKPDFIIP